MRIWNRLIRAPLWTDSSKSKRKDTPAHLREPLRNPKTKTSRKTIGGFGDSLKIIRTGFAAIDMIKNG